MSQPFAKKSGFTLIELLVVISIIALLLGILVPVLGVAKKNANILKESANLRNIHAALVAYGGGNKGWFAGLTSGGKVAGWDANSGTATEFIGKYYAAATNATASAGVTPLCADATAYAQAILLDEGNTNPSQWISPGETHVTGGNAAVTHAGGTVHQAASTQAAAAATSPPDSDSVTGMVSVFNSSFAVLAYGSGTLKSEWQSNQNHHAIVMGTRLMGVTPLVFDAGAGSSFNTAWTDFQSGSFKGSVVHGDTSTSTENFKRDDSSAVFGTLRYGSVVGMAPTDAALFDKVIGPYAHVETNDGNASYGTGAGQVGVGIAASGNFQTGAIVSGLN